MLRDPTFWVLVSFVIFVALAWKPLGRLILGALDERTARIRAQLDEAERLRQEAQDLLAEFQRKQRDAIAEADGLVAHARAEADRYAAESGQRLDTELKRREELAMQRIAQAEAQATAQVRAAAVDIAVAATRKLFADHLDAARSDAIVDRAIEELRGKLN